MEEKKSRRIFTPEQKYEILQDISTFRTVPACPSNAVVITFDSSTNQVIRNHAF